MKLSVNFFEGSEDDDDDDDDEEEEEEEEEAAAWRSNGTGTNTVGQVGFNIFCKAAMSPLKKLDKKVCALSSTEDKVSLGDSSTFNKMSVFAMTFGSVSGVPNLSPLVF